MPCQLFSQEEVRGSKGLRRIDELQAKFPDIPRSIIVKTDCVRLGVRWSPAVGKAGKWALPHVYHIYDWDPEESHKDLVDEAGWIQLPNRFALKDGTCILLRLEESSPYAIRQIGEGSDFMNRFELTRDDEPVGEVFFEPRPNWYTKRTSDGFLMSRVAVGNGDGCIIGFTMLSHCEYFSTGKPNGKDDACRFCNISPTMQRNWKMGLERLVKRRLMHMREVMKAANEEQEIGHINISGGALTDRRREARNYIEAVREINAVLGEDKVPIQIVSEVFHEDDLKELRDVGEGMVHISNPTEVWDEKLWPTAVPGKSKFVGRENWLKGLETAVKVLGYGYVASNLVGGLEMCPENGFRNVDDALASTLSGFRWLWEHEVIPNTTIWVKAPGAPAEDFVPPPTEYFLTLDHENYKNKFKYRPPSYYAESCYRKCYVLNCTRDYESLLGAPYLS